MSVPPGATSGVPAFARQRIDSVDLLRGLVMVAMALDHVRDFFHVDATQFDPTDPARTTVLLFFTRWITHFCAPTFVLLAGLGAFLYGARRTRGQLAGFLLSRGAWLILIEITVIRTALFADLDLRGQFLQVIWVIGWSLVVLAGLVFLPRGAILAFAVVTIAFHNLLDGLGPAPFSSFSPDVRLGAGEWVWSFLHVPNPPVIYPLVPWVGVMALGYALGPVAALGPDRRRRTFIRLGAALTLAFVAIRAVNLYGDPAPWSIHSGPVLSALSFLRTTKYPPSLLFLLMTLGPALVALGLFDGARGRIARIFTTYGRVPFFYYVLHLYLIRVVLVVAAWTVGYETQQVLVFPFFLPKGWGFELPVVYAIWIAIVAALYPACRWFADLKASRREPWLSYL